MSSDTEIERLRERVTELETQIDELADAGVDALDTGVYGDTVVLSRRQALAVSSGVVSLAALVGLSGSAAGQASADTNVGRTGSVDAGTVDVHVDQMYDEGGDEILNVDDTGAINAQFGRDWVFDSINGGGPISDGDGVERQHWLIANGAGDPSGADPEDLIFEEEA